MVDLLARHAAPWLAYPTVHVLGRGPSESVAGGGGRCERVAVDNRARVWGGLSRDGLLVDGLGGLVVSGGEALFWVGKYGSCERGKSDTLVRCGPYLLERWADQCPSEDDHVL